MVKKKIKKSKASSKVLQLMDKDYSYQKALKKTLKDDKRLNKKNRYFNSSNQKV